MPDVYNSAYTGTQIDAAIGAVRNKEEVWDAKQNKLTGSPGQVVGFDDEGDAIATPAPSGLPDGGTAGQMLYQGANGPEWGDKPVFIATTSRDAELNLSLDQPFADVKAAIDKGYYVCISVFEDGFGSTPILVPHAITFDETTLGFYAFVEGVMLTVIVSTGASGTHVDVTAAPYVNVVTTINGHPLSSNVNLDAEDVDAIPADEKGAASGVASLGSDGKVPASQLPDMDYVPTTRKVNGKALSADISLTADDVGARPNTWTPTASEVGAATPADVNATKPVLRTATLTTSGWGGNTQTVTVNGIIADSASQSVDVVPADHNSAKAWGDAGVWCDSQGANTLTFSCESVPTANITLNIRFQEAQT